MADAGDTSIAAVDLGAVAAALLTKAGLGEDKASIVADTLLEADLHGHRTHGLALLPSYLDALAEGSMNADGEPTVVAVGDVVQVWDGRRLPGPWLVHKAICAAGQSAGKCGVGIVVIRRAHHIASLSAYLEAPAREGKIVLIESSDPSVTAVAPHSGTEPLFTPNPIAVGIPTDADPIMVDISTSNTTIGLARQRQATGRKLDHAWLLDGNGHPTDDPDTLDGDPPGTLMLLGGLEAGHKGFGLSLMIEALTSGLGGHGRAEPAEGWGASVFVQVIDPAHFAGLDAFRRQTTHLSRACTSSRSRDPGTPVRMPGASALARKRALAQGCIELPQVLTEKLASWCDKLGVQRMS